MREQTRDYFAEHFVAGVLADMGWNIYFPHRDVGFDFIVSKETDKGVLIKPIQVKGKFPDDGKQDRTAYGWVGPLSAVHPDMVLVIAYFGGTEPLSSESIGISPDCIAFMPRNEVRPQKSKQYACQPAAFKGGKPVPRRDFKKYFDASGLRLMENL